MKSYAWFGLSLAALAAATASSLPACTVTSSSGGGDGGLTAPSDASTTDGSNADGGSDKCSATIRACGADTTCTAIAQCVDALIADAGSLTETQLMSYIESCDAVNSDAGIVDGGSSSAQLTKAAYRCCSDNPSELSCQ